MQYNIIATQDNRAGCARGSNLCRGDELRCKCARTAVLERELDARKYSTFHDLRAPLGVLDGFSQMFEEAYSGGLDANGINGLERVCAAARRLNRQI